MHLRTSAHSFMLFCSHKFSFQKHGFICLYCLRMARSTAVRVFGHGGRLQERVRCTHATQMFVRPPNGREIFWPEKLCFCPGVKVRRSERNNEFLNKDMRNGALASSSAQVWRLRSMGLTLGVLQTGKCSSRACPAMVPRCARGLGANPHVSQSVTATRTQILKQPDTQPCVPCSKDGPQASQPNPSAPKRNLKGTNKGTPRKGRRNATQISREVLKMNMECKARG